LPLPPPALTQATKVSNPMAKADSVLSTQRETASKIDRSTLMTRAWAIFRQTYCYPQIKFSDIGRKYFAWALRHMDRGQGSRPCGVAVSCGQG
jgi:hypothetical protein